MGANNETNSANTVKKIAVDQLRPGMYVHDLDCGWLQHPFLLNRFLVRDEATVGRIADAGIRQLYIDTERGDDVVDAPTRADVARALDRRIVSLAELRAEQARQTVSLGDERRRAGKLYRDASGAVQRVLHNARMGTIVELERLDPVVDSIVDSIYRHTDALIPLARLKRHDSYTYEHAVSSAAMMAAFGRQMNLSREQIREVALGAMLQDVGMARVPTEIVDKPSRLNPNEVAVVRGHVEHSHDIAQELADLPEASLEVIAQHHERIDGTGYPFRLRGDQISLHGQMAAIVDVYDAMTSQRPYQTATAPTQALRKLFEWGQHHFSGDLVQAFVRTIGIYPVGSLVRMESGMIGVVMEQTDDLLRPVVKIFFNTKTGNYLSPLVIRVGRFAGANHGAIVSHESFEKWNIDPSRWVPV
jgi:HD-GYP domain-containing protein (c-di-GMP phosphodiesterase class II)